jgi:hypothetical protein
MTDKNIDRLPGSRGQLTLSLQTTLQAGTVWWVFSFGETPPRLDMSSDNNSLMIESTIFHLSNSS